MSFSEVVASSTTVAAALARFGVCPEDRVLILLPDGPGFAEVFSAVTQLGAWALPVTPQLSTADVLALAAEIGAHLVVGWAERVQGITNDLETNPLTPVEGSWGLWVAALRSR